MLYHTDVLDDLFNEVMRMEFALYSQYRLRTVITPMADSLHLKLINERTGKVHDVHVEPLDSESPGNAYRVRASYWQYHCPEKFPLKPLNEKLMHPDLISKLYWDLASEVRPHKVVVEEMLTLVINGVIYGAESLQTMGTMSECDNCPKQLTCLEGINSGS